ncbi:thioredoxin family protein, partial [bacterium]|nr:thioredoxin family protein [bacterium]
MPEDEGIWTVNFEFAKKIAKEKDLNLLLLFTGSDWCVWCKKLNEEVFSQEAFQQEVVKMFVPVKFDFPSS